jgi:hypothetical protein
VVETVAEMAEAVQQVHQIDPNSCRRHVEENFGVSRLASDYLAAYQRILTVENLHRPLGQLPLLRDQG